MTVVLSQMPSCGLSTLRFLSPDYLDYLHLATTPDGWKITNVLVHSRG